MMYLIENEMPIKINLADRDLYLKQIEAQISAKRKFLLQKQKMLKEESKKNEFLDIVKNDYKKYYDFIIKQKEREIDSMNTLQQYLNDIIKTNKLTEEDLINSRKDQKNIVREINKMKGDLDELIKETDMRNEITQKNRQLKRANIQNIGNIDKTIFEK